MIKIEFTGGQDAINFLTHLVLRPDVKCRPTRYSVNGEVVQHGAEISVHVPPRQMSEVCDTLRTLQEVTGSGRVRNIALKNIQMGMLVEFEPGLIGEVNQHIVTSDLVTIGAPGGLFYREELNTRVRVHPNG